MNKNSNDMKEQLTIISDDLNHGIITENEARTKLLILLGVSGRASQLEEDAFKLINSYCKNGLKKPDLVKKMEWITGSCKMS
jgi:hypothetical protein